MTLEEVIVMPARRGFIPKPLTAPFELDQLRYRDDPEVESIIRQISAADNQVFKGRWAAYPDNTRLMLAKAKTILVDLKFSEEFIQRMWTCLGEDGANSMIYGLPGSTVSMAITIMGSAPTRVALVMIDNFLVPGKGTTFTPPDELPVWEHILDAVHGRGTGIVKTTANSFYRLVIPDFLVMNILHFLEDDGTANAPR